MAWVAFARAASSMLTSTQLGLVGQGELALAQHVCVHAMCTGVQGRRRRMLVEQQAARSAAEGRVEADCLLEVLVRRSAEEQKLAQHLWQLQQEKVRFPPAVQ